MQQINLYLPYLVQVNLYPIWCQPAAKKGCRTKSLNKLSPKNALEKSLLLHDFACWKVPFQCQNREKFLHLCLCIFWTIIIWNDSQSWFRQTCSHTCGFVSNIGCATLISINRNDKTKNLINDTTKQHNKCHADVRFQGYTSKAHTIFCLILESNSNTLRH